MNKQEFQQKLKDMKPPKFFNAITLSEAYKAGFEEAKGNALCDSCFLNVPEKPVVPQFVADWYEDNKDNFELSVKLLCVLGCEPVRKIDAWFDSNNTRPIETLVMMHKFGYEIEKEKRYTAKLKLTNEYLCYESQFKDLLHYKVPDSSAKEVKSYHFTEYDLVKYHVWGNNNYEVIEVI